MAFPNGMTLGRNSAFPNFGVFQQYLLKSGRLAGFGSASMSNGGSRQGAGSADPENGIQITSEQQFRPLTNKKLIVSVFILHYMIGITTLDLGRVAGCALESWRNPLLRHWIKLGKRLYWHRRRVRRPTGSLRSGGTTR